MRILLGVLGAIVLFSLTACSSSKTQWLYSFVIEEDDAVMASPRLLVSEGETAEILIEDEGTGERFRVEIMENTQIRVDIRQLWGGVMHEPTVLMEPDSEAFIAISDGPSYRITNERSRVSDGR